MDCKFHVHVRYSVIVTLVTYPMLDQAWYAHSMLSQNTFQSSCSPLCPRPIDREASPTEHCGKWRRLTRHGGCNPRSFASAGDAHESIGESPWLATQFHQSQTSCSEAPSSCPGNEVRPARHGAGNSCVQPLTGANMQHRPPCMRTSRDASKARLHLADDNPKSRLID